MMPTVSVELSSETIDKVLTRHVLDGLQDMIKGKEVYRTWVVHNESAAARDGKPPRFTATVTVAVQGEEK